MQHTQKTHRLRPGVVFAVVPASFKRGSNIDLAPAQSANTLQYILLFHTLTYDRMPTRGGG